MAMRQDIDAYLNVLLDVGSFKDYGPNGLQVQGRAEIRRLISGVTASLALIDAAIEARADALLVHHGLFWRGQDGRLTGWLGERVRRLMVNQISLFAYHLPLDAHPIWGNNTQLGKRLGFETESRFGEQNLACLASTHTTLTELGCRVQQTLDRDPVIVAGDGREIRRVAWCTGGAQGYFEDAIRAGADAFITGEISEPQAHLARETGVAFLGCGHHATERFGAPALGAHLAGHFALDHSFIDIPNPA